MTGVHKVHISPAGRKGLGVYPSEPIREAELREAPGKRSNQQHFSCWSADGLCLTDSLLACLPILYYTSQRIQGGFQKTHRGIKSWWNHGKGLHKSELRGEINTEKYIVGGAHHSWDGQSGGHHGFSQSRRAQKGETHLTWSRSIQSAENVLGKWFFVGKGLGLGQTERQRKHVYVCIHTTSFFNQRQFSSPDNTGNIQRHLWWSQCRGEGWWWHWGPSDGGPGCCWASYKSAQRGRTAKSDLLTAEPRLRNSDLEMGRATREQCACVRQIGVNWPARISEM